MYKYPELNSINAMDKELFNALKHDSLLHRCYENYSANYNLKPFDYKKFYVYLSYMALRMNQLHLKALITNLERSVNPPVVVQMGKAIYLKEELDKLIKEDKRSYWQKLLDAILGR